MNLNTAGWASAAQRLIARLRSESVNSTTPVTEISGGNISATNADIALVAKGTGATLAQVPDATSTGGSKRGSGATDWQKSRTSAAQVASGSFSTIGGGRNNTALGQDSTVAGGAQNVAGDFYCFIGGGQNNNSNNSYSVVCGGQNNNGNGSGTWSFVGGGLSNAASSNYSFVGGGQSNSAQTNNHATVAGGNSNTASEQYSFVGGGNTNSATASRACVVGGGSNIADAAGSFIAGGINGTTRGIQGFHVFPASMGHVGSTGSIQSGLLCLARQTTNATATVLTSNAFSASTTNQVILPNNSAYSFSGEVIAGRTAAGDTARWTIDGAIKRGANAASTAMVGTPTVTMTHNDAGASAWTVAVTADTTNGGIKVEVTGAAATTIRWVCKINTTEMTY